MPVASGLGAHSPSLRREKMPYSVARDRVRTYQQASRSELRTRPGLRLYRDLLTAHRGREHLGRMLTVTNPTSQQGAKLAVEMRERLAPKWEGHYDSHNFKENASPLAVRVSRSVHQGADRSASCCGVRARPLRRLSPPMEGAALQRDQPVRIGQLPVFGGGLRDELSCGRAIRDVRARTGRVFPHARKAQRPGAGRQQAPRP